MYKRAITPREKSREREVEMKGFGMMKKAILDGSFFGENYYYCVRIQYLRKRDRGGDGGGVTAVQSTFFV